VEFGSSSELDRVVSARVPLHRTGSLALTGSFQGSRVCLSWGSCSPRNASTSGAPARPNGSQAVREDEGRQAFAGAVLRVLAPLDGSSCARGTARALASSPLRRGAPTLRGLITCRSRLFGAALQSFPFPRSRTCSRRPLLPCGFASDYRQRGVSEIFTVVFPVEPALCLRSTRRRTETHEP